MSQNKNNSPSPHKYILAIGINYTSLNREDLALNGCIDDAESTLQLFEKRFGYTDYLKLVDRPDSLSLSLQPTRENIIRAIQYILNIMVDGDVLFIIYSGHGAQRVKIPESLIEEDGKSEVIVPLDYQTSGFIYDFQLHDLLVNNVNVMQKRIKIRVLFDACNSGTSLNLPHIYHYTLQDGQYRYRKDGQLNSKSVDILSLSDVRYTDVRYIAASDDSQDSSDIQIKSVNGKNTSYGLLTRSFQEYVGSGKPQTWGGLLRHLSETGIPKGQKPYISCQTKFDLLNEKLEF
jgi:Caspase domain